VALAGALAMILFKVIDAEEAFGAIDLNVIFLLSGMMIIANTLGGTGVFQWLAVRASKIAGGSPFLVLVILCTVTAFASAFLDNVTTVVLIAPVAIVVAGSLNVPSVPGLIAITLASNIGGTSTLIGDPPNILIGSHADLSFSAFLINLGPPALASMLGLLGVIVLLARRAEPSSDERRSHIMAMEESGLITDPHMLKVALAVLGVVVTGFVLQDWLHYEPAAVALFGGVLILLITRHDPHNELMRLEWNTLFFFIGLFMVVGGLEHTGVLAEIGERAVDLTNGSRTTSTFIVLWLSAILSGIVDNIPYTATMLPVIDELVLEIEREHPGGGEVLWWSLALGADLGGNLTIIGASANVLVANISARQNQPISFVAFFRWGSLTVLGTMLISSAYLWLRYLA
jgi:Na+/H+ antiporter NhaD/arsenite permease-like protein